MDSLEDKERFVERHKDEISPLGVRTEDTDAALEAYRVKIFKLEKSEGAYEESARRIALSVSDSLTLGTTRTLIERMVGDPRIRSIMLVTDNVAAKTYAGLLERDPRYAGFAEIDTTDGIMRSIGRETDERPLDLALSFIESQNSPSGSLAYEWKSAYGAKKLYLINEGWNGVGQRRDFFSRLDPDAVDAIFCNDETARKILASQMPSFADKIQVTGTPVLDDLGLDKGNVYRERGRAHLGISPNEVAVLFQGDVVADLTAEHISVDPRINVRTLEHLVHSTVEAARRRPEKRYVILVRPHGRDDPTDVRTLRAMQLPEGLPENVRLLDASENKLNMYEAAFAADIMTSINSTANHLAPKRGRGAVFLGFDDRLGAEVLKATYGDSYADIISGPGLHLVRSRDELVRLLERSAPALVPIARERGETATDRILNKMLGTDHHVA